jgi:hypothetical protein
VAINHRFSGSPCKKSEIRFGRLPPLAVLFGRSPPFLGNSGDHPPLGSLTQRYVKRHGRLWSSWFVVLRCCRANAFLKPYPAILSEHRFPNTVHEHDFSPFSGEIWASPGRSQFQGFRNTTAFRGQRYFFSDKNRLLENPVEIARPNKGMKTAENGGPRRISGQCHVALRTFA